MNLGLCQFDSITMGMVKTHVGKMLVKRKTFVGCESPD